MPDNSFSLPPMHPDQTLFNSLSHCVLHFLFNFVFVAFFIPRENEDLLSTVFCSPTHTTRDADDDGDGPMYHHRFYCLYVSTCVDLYVINDVLMKRIQHKKLCL